jgi:membrane protease YdiL (CAAX protease family)
MDEPNASPIIPPLDSTSPPALRDPGSHGFSAIFVSDSGVRAGWRLLIFFLIVAALFTAEITVAHRLRPGSSRGAGMALTPQVVLLSEGGSFLIVLLASWIMARFERRELADYGLPWESAFRLGFWQGAAIGFAGISALLAAMKLAGVFRVESMALHGAAMLKYAFLWGVVFLAVALFEEFGFRGYALFTLTTGAGFWPAALASSLLFGYVHHGNPGETWLGAFNAGLVGLLFCLMLRRTGDLWMAIGFHGAWDWGESYFYGVPDSGQLVSGHLLNVGFSGPRWLSGGSVGPEGSWLCTFLLVLLWLIFLVWLRDAKYPRLEAISVGPAALESPPAGNGSTS